MGLPASVWLDEGRDVSGHGADAETTGGLRRQANDGTFLNSAFFSAAMCRVFLHALRLQGLLHTQRIVSKRTVSDGIKPALLLAYEGFGSTQAPQQGVNMMKAGHFKAQLIAGCVAAAMSSGANALIVDLFSTNQGPHSDTTPTAGDTGVVITGGVGSSVGALDPTILGGNRDLYVSLLDNGGVNTREVSIGVAGGVLDFSVDTLTRGRGQIQWDGAENTEAIDFTGLGGINFGTAGSFELGILFSDGGFNFEITIYTDAANFTRISFVSTAHATPTTTFIPLAAFGNPALCGSVNPAPGVLSVTCGAGNATADLANVGALVVDLDRFGGTTAIDLTLDSIITTVPEPGSVALLGAGLLGLFGLGRRFKKLA
jgi:hypothetical protein